LPHAKRVDQPTNADAGVINVLAMSATLRQPASVVGNPSQVQTAIRVVLADDHATLRRTLRLLLESAQDVEVIAEAVDLSAVVDHVRRHAPRVLVLDLRLPKGSNIAMIAQLRKRFPETEVVVMTMEESPLFAQRAIDAGATGFVVTDRADTELVTAVRLAACGQEYVSARVASGLDALRRSGA
jgi:two-component system, NarL family, response regulator NreC